MDEFEMTRQRLPSFTIVCLIDLHLKKSIVVSILKVRRDRRKFLIRRHEWRRDIMGKEYRFSHDMFELYHVVVSDDTTTPSLRYLPCR